MPGVHPRILTMMWGEGDAVLVEIDNRDGALDGGVSVLAPGDSLSWTVPHRGRKFTISVDKVEEVTPDGGG